MEGSVDVWCIVHDGGLLLLTSYLLMRNRVWRKCDLRIFVVACEGDDTVNLKKDMTKFMYDLRINAAVDVVAMSTADISAYVAQRTANIEQRREILLQMKLTDTAARCDPQVIVDQHRKSLSGVESTDVWRPNTGKETNAQPVNELVNIPKVVVAAASETSPDNDVGETAKDQMQGDLLSTTPLLSQGNVGENENNSHHSSVTFATGPGPMASARERFLNGTMVGDKSPTSLNAEPNRQLNEFTFSPSHPLARKAAEAAALGANSTALTNQASVPPSTPGGGSKRSKAVRRMHSAARLNELLRTYSSNADLVIVNMPTASRTAGSEYNYMDYIEALTEGLPRVLLVRGTGREVITAFSE